MKKFCLLIAVFLFLHLFSGCNSTSVQIAATTLPVYDFTVFLCQGTGISVGRLITENVSCVHDYSLQVSQMRMIESAQVVIISGAGLENMMDDALSGARSIIDASESVPVHDRVEGHDDHDHDHEHNHDVDPHIWLSPENAKIMSQNICTGLCQRFPQYDKIFQENLIDLHKKLDDLQRYGEETLASLSCRELITFHDGFSYFAESFDLTILHAIEEESGREASALELIGLIEIVNAHNLPAVFIEANGSVSAADIISAETGVKIYTLNMIMSGDSYFDAMYHNIDTAKEALG